MNQNLSHALFHGTIETLKPGDVVKPRVGHAWATSDLQAALDHTRDRTISGYGEKDGGEYPVHHGNVYEVEPVNPTSVTSQVESGTKKAVASSEGFRVKKQVASVIGQSDNIATIKRSFPEFDPSKESYVKNGRDRGRI